MSKLKNQARLRLVKSEHLDLCSSYSRSAASPRGSLVNPYSISLTDDGARPTEPPICANVMPEERSSLTRDAHVSMGRSLRAAVIQCQRPTVTAVRDNTVMPRPPNMPELSTVGQRVRWWRKHRKFERRAFAKSVGLAYSTLADLENDRQDGSKQLHLIAACLRLNAHYLETGKGEPEAEYAQEAPQELEWPFPEVARQRLNKLNLIERKYAETKLLEALMVIESERRKSKRA